jgi:hypothetical protein
METRGAVVSAGVIVSVSDAGTLVAEFTSVSSKPPQAVNRTGTNRAKTAVLSEFPIQAQRLIKIIFHIVLPCPNLASPDCYNLVNHPLLF